MRVITLAILLTPSIAAADSYFQISGGLSVPVGDEDWDNNAESSPKLGLRAGGMSGNIGGVVSADWTPQQTDAEEFYGNSAEISAHRFRLLGGIGFEARANRALIITSRLQVGADIAYASASYNVFGIRGETSKTDVGFAFEVGVGLWANVGSVQIGGEVALPVAVHDNPPEMLGDIGMEWTSYDFDMLFGVRFKN